MTLSPGLTMKILTTSLYDISINLEVNCLISLSYSSDYLKISNKTTFPFSVGTVSNLNVSFGKMLREEFANVKILFWGWLSHAKTGADQGETMSLTRERIRYSPIIFILWLSAPVVGIMSCCPYVLRILRSHFLRSRIV